MSQDKQHQLRVKPPEDSKYNDPKYMTQLIQHLRTSWRINLEPQEGLEKDKNGFYVFTAVQISQLTRAEDILRYICDGFYIVKVN